MIIKDKKGQPILVKREKGKVYMCYICGRVASEEHHTISKNDRFKSDILGLTVMLCNSCHDKLHNRSGNTYKKDMQKLGQRVFEKFIGNRAEFMRAFHKNYLWEED